MAVVLSAICILPSALLAESFRIATPGYKYEFPRDHGAHDQYRLEWWYYTGHLTTDRGREFGFEVTFFRVGIEPPATPVATRWDLRNLAFAHFALTDVERRDFRYHQKVNRFVPFLAGAAQQTLAVFNEGWSVNANPDGSFRLVAEANGDAVDLTLRSAKPPAIHGRDGISVKGAGTGNASHYYSMTRLQADGFVSSKGRKERCRGRAWMDHEFSTSALRDTQVGWDWFSIQLDNNTELMLYQMRKRDGTADENSSGTFVAADGSTTHLDHDDFQIRPLGRWTSPRSGAVYPMGWEVTIPRLGLTLKLKEKLQNQELVTNQSTNVTYWEGAVSVEGTAPGLGYVEMSGYDRALTLP